MCKRRRLNGRADWLMFVGVCVLAGCVRVLGGPMFETPDGRTAAFYYDVRAARDVWFVHGHTQDVPAERYFVVRYGPSGTLQSCKVYSRIEAVPERRDGTLRQITTWPLEQRYRPGGQGPEPAPPLPAMR